MRLRLLVPAVAVALSVLTLPPATAANPPIVVVMANDIHAGSGTDTLRTATSNLALADHPVAAVLPGDIAAAGTAVQYSGSFARTWGRLPGVFAIPGNHDYTVPGAASFKAYFDVTVTYRSKNINRWHLIALDSQIPMGVGSAQYNWLKADLVANPARPILAAIHKPRYASFHADTPTEQPLINLLTAAKADLLIAGHDHIYQRSAPLGGILSITNSTAGLAPRALGTLDPHVVKAVSATGYITVTLTDTGYTLQFKDRAGVVRDTVTAAVHNQP